MNTNHELPHEVVALLHQVELNRHGWWDDTVDRLIEVALASSPAGLTAAATKRRIEHSYGIVLDPMFLAAKLEKLAAAKKVVSRGGSTFALTQKMLTTVQRQQSEARHRSEAVAVRFKECLSTVGCLLDPGVLWADFQNKLIGPLITQQGARTYNLAIGKQSMLEDSRPLTDFLDGIDEREHMPVKAAIEKFLDPGDVEVRTWLLSQLHAYFLMLATRADKRVLEAVSKIGRNKLEFVVVLDTNFLFSLLGLHSNPSNEAAELLVDLVAEISDRVSVSLCVLPVTLIEARDTLNGRKGHCPPGRTTPQTAEGALRSTTWPGLITRFLEETVRIGQPISRDDYFDPYIDGLEYILEQHGVSIIEDIEFEQISQLPAVRDQVNKLHKESVSHGRKKTWASIRHDVVLWHYVNEKRPARAKPGDAKYWGVSVDFAWLLRFDKTKREAFQGLPRVVHPTQFIQMLQFWVPRTERMEKALLGSTRQPLFFTDFDQATEQVTLKILSGIARYASTTALSSTTVVKILQDQVLRSMVEQNDQPDVIDKEVETSAFRLVEAANAERQRIDRDNERLRTENEQLRYHRTAKERINQGQTHSKKQMLSKVSSMEQKLQTNQRRQRELETENHDLKRTVEEIQENLEKSRTAWLGRVHFLLTWTGSTLVILGGCAALWFLKLDTGGTVWRFLLLSLCALLLILSVGHWAARRFVANDEEWPVLATLARYDRGFLLMFVAALVGTVVQFGLAPPTS